MMAAKLDGHGNTFCLGSVKPKEPFARIPPGQVKKRRFTWGALLKESARRVTESCLADEETFTPGWISQADTSRVL